ncbi:MAG: ATP-binding protein [Anaerolineae bacterium]|nr:MAG: ATP-binding protein [Anaerolineae bacterium]
MFVDVSERERRRQFRLCRLQVYNWGTFHGLHDITIARRGFLFVGRSGSGKSTLLDAIAALLTPPQWLSFNAAAREGDRSRRDRNLVSYVRGAWGDRTDEASGTIATHYLRRGTTWSALALTLASEEGARVTLVHLYWIRGAGTATGDVRKHFMIATRDFDIASELDDFDLDVRALKRRLEDVDHFGDTFRPYGERFRRLLDIESEQALKLLHKTQSAKNLGDLNSFLREFMLDRPDTFDAAQRLVSEFSELDAAHREVLTARRQVETLQPAREDHDSLQRLDADIAGNERLLTVIDAYADERRQALLEAAITERQGKVLGLTGEIEQQQERLRQARETLHDLELAHRERGGERIARLEEERQRLETRRDERQKKRGALEEACRVLDWPVPGNAGAFGERVMEARNWLDAWQAQEDEREQQRDALRDRHNALTKEFADLRREIEAMERQPSNIPAHMLELRARLAGALDCAESELPFVGELLEVPEEEATWRGAIERVLHGFALSLLVDKARYAGLTEWVDAHALGTRLVYYRVGDAVRAGGVTPGPQSLFHKLKIKETVFRPWLEAELLRRFDYACVDNLRAFRKAERAITRAGQVRHGRARHEKDDRRAIDDRRHWVLGFDNREKLAHFRQRAGEVGAQIAEVEAQLRQLKQEREKARERIQACTRLANLEWTEVDVASVLDRLAEIDRELQALHESNAELRDLDRQISEQRNRVEQLDEALRDLRTKLAMIEKEMDEYSRQQEEVARRLEAAVRPDEADRETLAARFKQGDRLSLRNLDERRRKTERAINAELTRLREQRAECVKRIERAFAAFKSEWPEAAKDMDATLDSAPDFLQLLTRLERDGLPRHEERFFTMLREQSSENLAALNTRLSQARKAIRERMEVVNEGLAEAEFNPGTHLQIEVVERYLPDVRDFQGHVREILSHAWAAGGKSADRQRAERRFAQLKELVDRLAGNDAETRRWRDLVLDVRLHVEFIGRELNAEGGEVEIYRSGAGKSGGQREKLATTCLAAALRYQLGGSEDGLPRYAAVVLDEAFGKADNEFTELAMGIFDRFGFQMIVATPLKAVMTLEPFIGGACFVEITDRRHSATLAIEYDETRQRLDLPRQAHGQEQMA